MGAAIVAPPAAAAAAAALAEAAPAPALVAIGPAGWIAAGVAAAAGIVVVAGDEEFVDRRCWQQIILPSASAGGAVSAFSINSTDNAQDHEPIDIDIDFHNEHGMLLTQVLSHTEAFKSKDDDRLIVKNRRGEYFAFSVTLVVPVHETGPELEHDVTIVHAVPVGDVDIGSYSPL